MRDLDQVVAHEHDGLREATGIQGKPTTAKSTPRGHVLVYLWALIPTVAIWAWMVHLAGHVAIPALLLWWSL